LVEAAAFIVRFTVPCSLVFLASVGLPLPGETILVSAAILAGATQAAVQPRRRHWRRDHRSALALWERSAALADMKE
jgi:hypothetical protein